MKPERWQQITDIFQSAVARDPRERPRFLEEKCDGDAELRREVESLIESHDSAGSFIESPAYEVGAELMTGAQDDPLVGRVVGRYRVESLLGAGGMGEVYLAVDAALGRRVALKFLPRRLTADESQLRRFRQEARAASTLNHPGIVTIHEVGEDEGRHFIAAEYVEGLTLRERLNQSRPAPAEALDIAAQAADALGAAHRAGIVHRDVKPENVMLRPDGYVKVLDFGLAKLTGAHSLASDGRGANVSAVDTEPGVVMGTVAYMSPEQARSKEVDERADVWSLGVVLYEMLTGAKPFDGETPSHCIVSILEDEPPPLEGCAPEVAAEIQSVLDKALSKDREGRYPSAKELADDLKALRGVLLGAPGGAGAVGEVYAGGGRVDTAGRAARPTGGHTPARTGPLRTRRAAKAAAGALAVAVAVFGLYKLFSETTSPAPVPFQSVGLTRLTNHGSVITAALSPDGEYAAYALAAPEGQSLWVKHVPTSSAAQIAPPAPVQYHGLTFSPDGGYIYTLASEGSRGDVSLLRVPKLGGSTSKLPVVSDTPVSFSPDGAQFTFVEIVSTRGESLLYVTGADGTGRRLVATLRQPDFFAAYPGGPVWSPDGSVVASPAGLSDAEGHYMGVVAVGLEGGAMKTVGTQRWASISHVAWLAGGRGLVLTARDKASSPRQVWHLSYPEGEARKITNDLNDYSSVSVTADAAALVAVQTNVVSSVWVVPEGETAGARKVATEAGEIGVIAWTPDGRIAYRSNDYRNAYIGLMGADGAGLRKVAFDARIKEGLSVSPDGRHVVFASDRAGRYNLWRADVETGEVTRLTSGNGEIQPAYTPDGRWVVYQQGYGLVKPTLWKIPAEGGEPVRLTETHAAMPSVSADGRLLAYTSLQKIDGETLWRVVVMPAEGGPPVETLDLGVMGARLLRWTPDGRALTYVHDQQNVSNVWVKPLGGGPARPVTDFKDESILSFDWSRDGRTLAVARGDETRDAVLVKDLFK